MRVVMKALSGFEHALACQLLKLPVENHDGTPVGPGVDRVRGELNFRLFYLRVKVGMFISAVQTPTRTGVNNALEIMSKGCLDFLPLTHASAKALVLEDPAGFKRWYWEHSLEELWDQKKGCVRKLQAPVLGDVGGGGGGTALSPFSP